MAKTTPAKVLRKALTALGRKYGRQRLRSLKPPFEETMLAILEGDTTGVRAREGLEILKRDFVDWNEVRVSPVRELEDVLEAVGGDLVTKAELVRAVLADLFSTRHSIDMDHVAGMKPREMREYFSRFPGMPRRVIEHVVLYSAGGPAFPVTADARRVAARLGILSFELAPPEAEQALTKLVLRSRAYSFVELFGAHADETCTARRPRCTECVLKSFCPKILTVTIARKLQAEVDAHRKKRTGSRPKKAGKAAVKKKKARAAKSGSGAAKKRQKTKKARSR